MLFTTALLKRKRHKTSSMKASVSNSDEELELLESNPKMKRILEKYLHKEKEKELGSHKGKCVKPTEPRHKSITPLAKFPEKVKSPSDTTLYMPALKRDGSNNLVQPQSKQNPHLTRTPPNDVNQFVQGDNNTTVIDQIINFVEQMRVQSVNGQNKEKADRLNTHDGSPSNSPSGRTAGEQTMMKQLVVKAEQFKVTVEPPKGITADQNTHVPGGQVNEFEQILKKLLDNDDDEFFHLTCHIDSNLKSKIEKGEFVDLERLLPKTRAQIVSEDQKMQFVNRDGASFWIPADRESKINGIRKWDQAFRIYAAIYSKHNPNRAAEIWQYIHVINTAAASYTWENVCYYDLTFRRLMHEKPHRSWAKMYIQVWNLAMCDPILKNTNKQGYTNFHSNSNSTHSDWRDRCCWRFNRGEKCKKWNCRFDHRCNNCGSWSHCAVNCTSRPKHHRKDDHSDRGYKRS